MAETVISQDTTNDHILRAEAPDRNLAHDRAVSFTYFLILYHTHHSRLVMQNGTEINLEP